VVRVLDPRHPLYGRSFRVIRRTASRGGNFLPSYEVEYLNGGTLLVPVDATQPNISGPNQTKLSIEALHELVVAVECLEQDEHRAKESLGGAGTGPSASDRQRNRCSSDGDFA